MSHFAQVDENDVVIAVIVAEQDFIDSGAVGDPTSWIQTSFNTRGGIHYGPDGNPDGGIALRANFAVIGSIYDRANDAFYPPKPVDNPSFVMSGAPKWVWTFPVPKPVDRYKYDWDEATVSWVLKPEAEWRK